MTATLYAYPGCSTCRSARRWLDERGVAYRLHDLGAAPPELEALQEIHRRSGLPVRKLFNTSGQSYRAGGWSQRLPALDDAAALAELARDGMLVKRPILVTGGAVLVGFSADAYARALE